MQDIHTISGGGRFFGGGDRRLRQHSHQQALKCPRCDSLNTKFCYYNNYNLSQPRHFCKNCRRYWTKGGVLRNVPVGGGCRKTKRSSKPKTGGETPRERSSNARSSSSESSGAGTAAVAEQGEAPSNTTPPDSAVVYNISDSRSFDGNPNLNRQVNPSTEDQIFPAESGNFGRLTATSFGMLGFGMADISTTSYGQVQHGNQAPASPENTRLGTASIKDFKAPVGMSDGGLVTSDLDWGGCGDGGGGGGDLELFDLTAAVDPEYWSQPQWTDGGDQSLDYLR